MGDAAHGDGHDVVLRHRGLHRCCCSRLGPATWRRWTAIAAILRDGLDRPRRHRDGHRGRQLLRGLPRRPARPVRRRPRHSAGSQQHPWPGGELVRVRDRHPHRRHRIVHDGDYWGMDVHRAARIAGVGARRSGGDVGGHRGPGPGRACRRASSCVTSACTTSRTSPSPSTSTSWRRTGCRTTSRPLRILGTVLEPASSGHPADRTRGRMSRSSTALLGHARGPPGDADRARRLREDPAGDRGRRTPGDPVPRRRVLRAARLGDHRRGDVDLASAEVLDVPPRERTPDRLSRLRSPGARSCSSSTTSSRSSGADEVVARAAGRSARGRGGHLDVAAAAGTRRGARACRCAPLALPERRTLWAGARAPAPCSSSCERARSVQPRLRLTPENVADVVAICRRLDGLPLAIELCRRPDPGARPAGAAASG